MQKICFIILFYAPLIGVSQAQKEVNPRDLSNVIYNFLSDSAYYTSVELPFKNIRVLDARFDTSKIGFEVNVRNRNLGYKDFKKIKLEGGIQKSMEQFFNGQYQKNFKDEKNELLIVLKTLWIDNLPTNTYFDTKRYMARLSYQNVFVKVECYLRTDIYYYPLIRIDTLFQLTPDIEVSDEIKLYRNDLSFFKFSIESLIEKYDYNSMIKNIDRKRMLTFTMIDSFNNKRFALPILNTAIRKGAFINADDFINNSPTINNFIINKKGLLVNNVDPSIVYKYWMFCNDEGLYISTEKNSKVKRLNNTFEFFRHDQVHIPKTMAGTLLSTFSNRRYQTEKNDDRLINVLVPRQLNMETGEIY